MRGDVILRGFADLMAANELLLLFVLVGLGSAVGRLRWRGASLGPAAVLFAALALSWYDPRLALPAIVGQLGLVLFAYTIGVSAGPSFFATVRTGGRAVLVVVGALLLGALAALGAGAALGVSGPVLSGAYAGALTNTPALAASLDQLASKEPTVGYSVTYLFGVLGMLLAAAVALRRAPRDVEPSATADAPPPPLEGRTVRVEAAELPALYAIEDRYDQQVVFSRIMRGDSPGHPGVVSLATDDLVPAPGDILTLVGPAGTVDRVVAELGHPSTVALVLDRSKLDYRRMIVSHRDVVGRTIGELRLPRRFGATVTRIRRGDVELLASPDLVLQTGDRVRVVGPRDRLSEVSAALGDSEREASDINPVGLALGLVLGLLLGLLVVPLPGGREFSLGIAAGPLVVGLLLGRMGRTGRVVWSLPYQASNTMNQLGMLLFLAFAGSSAGPSLARALQTSEGPKLFLVGIVITSVTAVFLVGAGSRLAHAVGPRLAGQVAGAGTQPAVLAYVDERTGGDTRVNMGYALVYPVAMIVKVIVAPIIGSFFF